METAITVLLWILGGYFAAGLVFAPYFLIKGLDRIDSSTAGTGWGFRLIIIPGLVAFWPIIFKKWLKNSKTE